METSKWTEVLRKIGHSCFWFAGELDKDPHYWLLAYFISLPGLFLLPGPPSALSADLSRRSFSEAGTDTYVIRMRGCVGGALSNGRPYPDGCFVHSSSL